MSCCGSQNRTQAERKEATKQQKPQFPFQHVCGTKERRIRSSQPSRPEMRAALSTSLEVSLCRMLLPSTHLVFAATVSGLCRAGIVDGSTMLLCPGPLLVGQHCSPQASLRRCPSVLVFVGACVPLDSIKLVLHSADGTSTIVCTTRGRTLSCTFAQVRSQVSFLSLSLGCRGKG